MIICYTVPEIWCMTDLTVTFHSELFFVLNPSPPLTTQKIKISKNEKKKTKKTGDIILHMCTKN